MIYFQFARIYTRIWSFIRKKKKMFRNYFGGGIGVWKSESNCLNESVEKDFLGDVGGARRERALDATRFASLGRCPESVAEKSSIDIEFCLDRGVAHREPERLPILERGLLNQDESW